MKHDPKQQKNIAPIRRSFCEKNTGAGTDSARIEKSPESDPAFGGAVQPAGTVVQTVMASASFSFFDLSAAAV